MTKVVLSPQYLERLSKLALELRGAKTLREVAAEFGISHGTWGAWERKDITSPPMSSNLQKLALRKGWSLDGLIEFLQNGKQSDRSEITIEAILEVMPRLHRTDLARIGKRAIALLEKPDPYDERSVASSQLDNLAMIDLSLSQRRKLSILLAASLKKRGMYDSPREAARSIGLSLQRSAILAVLENDLTAQYSIEFLDGIAKLCYRSQTPLTEEGVQLQLSDITFNSYQELEDYLQTNLDNVQNC